MPCITPWRARTAELTQLLLTSLRVSVTSTLEQLDPLWAVGSHVPIRRWKQPSLNGQVSIEEVWRIHKENLGAIVLTSMNEIFKIPTPIRQERHHLIANFKSYEKQTSKPGDQTSKLKIVNRGAYFLHRAERHLFSFTVSRHSSGLEWLWKGMASPSVKGWIGSHWRRLYHEGRRRDYCNGPLARLRDSLPKNTGG